MYPVDGGPPFWATKSRQEWNKRLDESGPQNGKEWFLFLFLNPFNVISWFFWIWFISVALNELIFPFVSWIQSTDKTASYLITAVVFGVIIPAFIWLQRHRPKVSGYLILIFLAGLIVYVIDEAILINQSNQSLVLNLLQLLGVVTPVAYGYSLITKKSRVAPVARFDQEIPWEEAAELIERGVLKSSEVVVIRRSSEV